MENRKAVVASLTLSVLAFVLALTSLLTGCDKEEGVQQTDIVADDMTPFSATFSTMNRQDQFLLCALKDISEQNVHIIAAGTSVASYPNHVISHGLHEVCGNA